MQVFWTLIFVRILKRGDFGELIGKFYSKVRGWNTKVLSLVNHATLIKKVFAPTLNSFTFKCYAVIGELKSLYSKFL